MEISFLKNAVCVKPDKYHNLGHEYTLTNEHDMPGWIFVRETGKYASKRHFRPLDDPIAMAAIENRRISEKL